ncbi:MAG: hypothetical protein C5B50_21765 [Verrucomicrobia bacterium]|nr:MAG: hypothetical protein C5B50_21765 [Verrucomicrobiota bacterium]
MKTTDRIAKIPASSRLRNTPKNRLPNWRPALVSVAGFDLAERMSTCEKLQPTPPRAPPSRRIENCGSERGRPRPRISRLLQSRAQGCAPVPQSHLLHLVANLIANLVASDAFSAFFSGYGFASVSQVPSFAGLRRKKLSTYDPTPGYYWLSYIEDDPHAYQALLGSPSGGVVSFPHLLGTTPEYYTATTLLRQTTEDGSLAGFVRTYANGVVDSYQYIPPDVLLPDNNIPVFLSTRTDAFGRVLLSFQYEEDSVPGVGYVVRLKSVKDSDGRLCLLDYTNSAAPSLITTVTDPFGRTVILKYDNNSMLTNITEVAGLSSSVRYSNGWVTNLTTPSGTTSFYHFNIDPPWSGSETVLRAITVVDAAGGTNIYGLWQTATNSSLPDFSSALLSALPDSTFDDAAPYLVFRNSFHWGPRQAAGLPTDFSTFGSSQFVRARMRHWLHAGDNCDYNQLISQTLSIQVEPSPDGVNPGQMTFYDYAGKICNFHEGTNSLPSAIARVLPDGSVSYSTYDRDQWQRPTTVTETYSTGYGATPRTRSWQYLYSDDGIDLVQVLGPRNETLAGFAYTNHAVLRATNSLSDVTSYTLDLQGRVTSIKTPAGLTTTNRYFATGTYTNFIQMTIDMEINRTNSFIFTNDLVAVHTDERGLSTTNLYDPLNRLTASINPLGAVSYTCNKLDLGQVQDRMGFSTWFGYDGLRRKIAETNALGYFTLYNYCTCGALDSIQDAAGHFTLFYYDKAGRRTASVYADSYAVTNNFNLFGEVTNTVDSAGYSVTNWFNNQGLRCAVSNAVGRVSALAFDDEDRATNSVDANGVSVASTFDELGRVLTRSYPDAGVEQFKYSAAGLMAYTNQLGFGATYTNDVAARKIAERNANSEVTRFSYSAAGDLLTLTDGKLQTTTWYYDKFGRVTNKLDQTSTSVLQYTYDLDGRLTNRWSAAKGNTAYSYSAVGNLYCVQYPSSGSVCFEYDPLKRMTNMVDWLGTTSYSYDSAGQLLSETCPWASTVVSYTYTNRLRQSMTVQTPWSATWSQTNAYDSARRFKNIISPAGTFTYSYLAPVSQKPASISLPNTAAITNVFDSVARLKSTTLKHSGGTVLDSASYTYNAASLRTGYTNAAGDTVAYTNDPIGQLRAALSSVSGESRGYAYDSAWNLNYLTNGDGTTGAFTVDSLNQLTSAPPGSCGYDANGNLISQAGVVGPWGSPGNVTYCYDDENRLVSWIWTDPNETQLGCSDTPQTYDDWRTDFVYDGLGRLRQTTDYDNYWGTGWNPATPNQYAYDGWLEVSESTDANYTRGPDLSGTLQGAGGIGGLLAGTYASGGHLYAHSDGNGNLTCLLDDSQNVVTTYRYDPFGNLLPGSGQLGHGLSSKQFFPNNGLYYFGYRFYAPSLQRWINRDPISELGFEELRDAPLDIMASIAGGERVNLFRFVGNCPQGRFDKWGLKWESHWPSDLVDTCLKCGQAAARVACCLHAQRVCNDGCDADYGAGAEGGGGDEDPRGLAACLADCAKNTKKCAKGIRGKK